jgi:peptidoglycan/xylan/chitin deacetylase (PgdA/CDA1 family)
MKWRNEIKCAVCFTFDVDGPLIWRNKARIDPRFANPVCLSAGDFGPSVGVPRILKLLKQYDIKGGFFIPGGTIEEYPDVARQIMDEGHEICFHSYNHVNPAELTYDQEKEDFEKGLEVMQKVLNTRPYGYRSAGADMSENTWNFLDEYDFVYDSTMMGADYPYLKKMQKNEMVILPLHYMLDDWTHFGWNLYPPLASQANMQGPDTVYEIWRAEFEGMYRLDEGCCFTLLMHPQLSGRASRIELLERLIRHIRGFSGSWIAKPIEIAREARDILAG